MRWYMSDLLNKTNAIAQQYLATVNQEKIQVSEENHQRLSALDFELQNEQVEADDVIEKMNDLTIDFQQ